MAKDYTGMRQVPLTTTPHAQLISCRQMNGKFTVKMENLLEPIPTDETKSPNLSSVYALSKYDQEQLCLLTCKAYNIPVSALRFFNVYGTRQSLRSIWLL